jgi:ADP-ribosylglycohydrolase
MNTDRARGALLGLAVGDALGTTYEFEHLEQPAYPALATKPATDVVGAGPFHLAPGAITDDTQLAVCLARSLADHGELDIEDVARRYVAWSAHAFDIGSQTSAAIRRLEDGDPASAAGTTVWRMTFRQAAGNGSLMRTAPIGVAFAQHDRARLIEAAIADSLITHGDPRCALACAAFDAAIADAIRSERPALLDAARSALAIGAQRLAARWSDPEDRACVERAQADLERDLVAAAAVVPDVYGDDLHLHRRGGFVRVAFRLAFWHAAHTPSWRDAVVDVASRGGDADTNAAIAGALLGARDGESAIPEAWRLRVLGATQPGPADWAEAHHPRRLLALVGRP